MNSAGFDFVLVGLLFLLLAKILSNWKAPKIPDSIPATIQGMAALMRIDVT